MSLQQNINIVTVTVVVFGIIFVFVCLSAVSHNCYFNTIRGTCHDIDTNTAKSNTSKY